MDEGGETAYSPLGASSSNPGGFGRLGNRLLVRRMLEEVLRGGYQESE